MNARSVTSRYRQRWFQPWTLALALCGISPGVQAGPETAVCSLSGMAGFVFGNKLDGEDARLVETTYSGIRYYALRPSANLQQFEQVVVGVTPISQVIFWISLLRFGQADEIDRQIAEMKNLLSRAHPRIEWLVIGHHHYGKAIDGLDLTLYRIGDIRDGLPGHELNYDCLNKARFRQAMDEVRALAGSQQ